MSAGSPNTVASLCGWQENPQAIAACAAKNGSLARVASNLIGGEQRDCYLWQALLKCKPTWRRGAQGIGDCFVAGTLVLMADGTQRPIESVVAGEYVRTSTGSRRRVLDTIKKPYSGTLLAVHVRGCDEHLVMTPDHNVRACYASGLDWAPIGSMATGECLQVPKGAASESLPGYVQTAVRERVSRGVAAPIESITAHEVVNTHVYCLTVEYEHEFIANGVTVKNCVSWGLELAETMLMAVESIEGKMQWVEEAATEPNYGGARVEGPGRRGDWSDGAVGAWAAEWARDYGVLLRLDYSQQTGNPEHDLRKYSKKKAKDWGYYGCGGQNDKGKLDALAKQHPIRNVTQVNRVEEAIAALTNAYPITIASSAGFGDMRRDENGLCYWRGSWAHQMELGGIRWRDGKPEFRCFQSWGDSCSGPDPGIDDTLPKLIRSFGGDGAMLDTPHGVSDQKAFKQRLILPYENFPFQSVEVESWNPISACSWWIDERTLARILSSGDCWTYSGVSGFEPRKIDTLGAIRSWIDDLV